MKWSVEDMRRYAETVEAFVRLYPELPRAAIERRAAEYIEATR